MDLWQDAAISAFAPWESVNIALPLFFFGVALSQIAVLKQHGVLLKKSKYLFVYLINHGMEIVAEGLK